MKFKELREADLSKAQIKKVHDKADDLPKNDFIKRYGKDGDSVRFATATKMVKKELGIDEKSTEDKLKKWGPVKQLPPLKGAKLGKPVKAEYEEESVKEEVELTEGRVIIATDKKTKKKWQFSGGMTVKFNGKQYKTEGVGMQQVLELYASFGSLKLGKPVKAEYEEESVKEGGPGSGPRHKEVTLTRNGKTKTVKGIAAKIFTDAGWKLKEEVELDENISGEVVAKGYAKTIAQMTDRNDHFGARKYIANLIKDKQLANMYDMLDQMHSLTNGAGNHAISLRSRLEQILKYRVGKKLRPDIAKIILGGL